MSLMKRLIVFDLDGTLTESKSAIKPAMAALLRQLLNKFETAVISGADFAQFKLQLLEPLAAAAPELAHLHILPTNGTHYWHCEESKWHEVYAHDIPKPERAKIVKTMRKVAKELGYWPRRHWGKVIDDRGSQITFSALGQDIVKKLGQKGLGLKASWDPDGSKKQQLCAALIVALPGYAIHSAGLTSEDVTLLGMDKATAIANLASHLSIPQKAVVYVGDALEHGGNDLVVAQAGFDVIKVYTPADTEMAIKGLLKYADEPEHSNNGVDTA